ncbi:hypothetical protein [Streptomyces griseus]|uniref:hypothetical protein n=1 Tax=Streptomyces griseus TaxID=1911 RepID=UPI000A3B1392|nr:hypothetical protein [Streptomyces fimicarius]
MDTELTIAAVGTGGALLGALIGGGAALMAAKQGYKGALEAVARTAQHDAHRAFLDATHSYWTSARGAVRAAIELTEACIAEETGDTPDLSPAERQRHRITVSVVAAPDKIDAATQAVHQAGPPVVHEAARTVLAAARNVRRVFNDVEVTEDQGQGHHTVRLDPSDPADAVRELKAAMDAFAAAAGKHGGHQGALIT